MDASVLNYTVNDNVGKFLGQKHKLYINGEWVDSKSGKTFDVEDPATGKKDLIQRLAIKDDIDNVHFYDDDPENAKRVEQLCNDPELAGTEIDIYNYEYAKGAKPTTPTSSCTVGMKMSESQNLKISES